MMPRTGGSVFGQSRPILEIKPDSPFVVLYGDASVAQSADITGKLVLNNAESMSVKSLKLTLTGMRKVSLTRLGTGLPQPAIPKVRFLHETRSYIPTDGVKNRAHKMNAGCHEWEFKFTLPGNTDESVEGLPMFWIVYDLTATLERGYMSKDLTATSHIRVIRTIGQDSSDTMPTEQINEDIWASKLAYKIILPQKNYIIGTSIRADFVLIPLRKGVEISTIKMELIEHRDLHGDYGVRIMAHQSDVVIASMEGTMPETSAHLVPEGVEDVDQIFDEAHRFSMSLELPKSLKYCRQTVDTDFIRLTHKLRIYVNIKNPEGHTSQLLVKNQIRLFISPNLPPREDQSVVVDHNIINADAMREQANQNAPPTYGRHQLDELYQDIDPSGFMTPNGIRSLTNSGANTPFYSHSRSGSVEDLASLNAITQQAHGGASASALQTRLDNLSISQNRAPRYASSRHHSSGGSTPLAPDDASHLPPVGYFPDPMGHQYDLEALSRTPSYNTAVRTPGRSAVSEDLPTYDLATSRPSSPSTTPGPSQPSPASGLAPVVEETERNEHVVSREASPGREPRTSDEGR